MGEAVIPSALCRFSLAAGAYPVFRTRVLDDCLDGALCPGFEVMRQVMSARIRGTEPPPPGTRYVVELPSPVSVALAAMEQPYEALVGVVRRTIRLVAFCALAECVEDVREAAERKGPFLDLDAGDEDVVALRAYVATLADVLAEPDSQGALPRIEMARAPLVEAVNAAMPEGPLCNIGDLSQVDVGWIASSARCLGVADAVVAKLKGEHVDDH